MLRFLFAFILLIHGLIHLMGFTKAFKFAEVSQLHTDISKPAGLGWLAATLLFVVSTALFLLKKDLWWAPAALGIAVSQILIFGAWQDAKFGTIANLIALIGVLPGLGNWQFQSMLRSELAAFRPLGLPDTQAVAESQLAPLPTAVQNWLRRSGVVGQPKTSTLHLRQTGQMRTTPNGNWMPVSAEQYFRTDPPGFHWTTEVDAGYGLYLAGRDLYQDGRGHMLIKALSLFPVADAKGPETDQGTLLRYLAETCWFPDAALQPYIQWEAIDSASVKATMRNGDITASGVFHFSPEGDLLGFEAMRYYDRKGGATLEKWHIENDPASYQVFQGRRIPTRSSVSWLLPEGKFTWFQLEISDVRYNE